MNEPKPYRVIAAGGMLGRAWCRRLRALGVASIGIDHPHIDITDPASVAASIPQGTGVIVNCAAYTDVDRAESDEATATKVNGDAVAILADHAARIGATLVHYSTDYVFDGRAAAPYPIDTPHHPINAYGRSKAAGEKALIASSCDYRLIRTSWLYAPWGKNFVRTMLRLTTERAALDVVDDQRGRPTSAEHLAATSLTLLTQGRRGIYHVADGGDCTWCDFAVEITRQAGHACDIRPCASDRFPRPAQRPAYSVLDLSRTEAITGPMPDWRQNLREVLGRIDPAFDHNRRAGGTIPR